LCLIPAAGCPTPRSRVCACLNARQNALPIFNVGMSPIPFDTTRPNWSRIGMRQKRNQRNSPSKRVQACFNLARLPGSQQTCHLSIKLARSSDELRPSTPNRADPVEGGPSLDSGHKLGVWRRTLSFSGSSLLADALLSCHPAFLPPSRPQCGSAPPPEYGRLTVPILN
jgi:hypothetical protein